MVSHSHKYNFLLNGCFKGMNSADRSPAIRAYVLTETKLVQPVYKLQEC